MSESIMNPDISPTRRWVDGCSSAVSCPQNIDLVWGRLGIIVISWLFATCGVELRAQVETAYSIGAAVQSEELGNLVVNAGDVDGDGCDDILTSPGTENSALGEWVRLYSGVDGSLLMTLTGPTANADFGCAITALDDLDGDGTVDFAVGARYDGSSVTSAGAVTVFSGATGATLYTIVGAASGDYLGSALCSIADLDGDGLRDFVVGIPGSDSLGMNFGEVRVFSAASGASLIQIYGNGSGTFGEKVAPAGDFDGDGKEDFAVGIAQVYGSTPPILGEVSVYSGASGGLLKSFLGTSSEQRFGESFVMGDDMNGDGVPELFVGEPGTGPGAFMPQSGRLRCLSGQDGSVLASVWGEAQQAGLGGRVAAVSDLDGDGKKDLLVFFTGEVSSTTGNSVFTGGVRIFSSSSLAVLAEVHGDNHLDVMGFSMAGGDFNGDGLSDFAAGAPGVKIANQDSGLLRVFSGQPRTSTQIGGGQPNTDAAELLVNGYWTGTMTGPFNSTVQRGQTFTLDFRGAPNSLLTLYWSPLLNPGGWIFPGFGSFDLGTGPTFTDVHVAFDGFAGGFLYYGTDSLGRFQQSYHLPFGWPTGPFVNIQALVQHAQPWFTWATITAAHVLVVQ